VTNTIFGRCELAVADVYLRNGSGSNIGAQDLQYLSVFMFDIDFFLNNVINIKIFFFFFVIYFHAHTGKWQNNQQFDGGHSAVEVDVLKVR
jgi:hypothetical protein